MKIGFVGLGKMGYQIVAKLVEAGNEVIAFDINHEAVVKAQQVGAITADSRGDLVTKLGENPIIWLMIPSDFVTSEIEQFADLLQPGALLIDGGNTNYRATLDHGAMLSQLSIDLVDVGTSGGIMGLRNGFSLMVGGSQQNYNRLCPIFDALVQPAGMHRYMGPTGYGHYVKMIHNGIEYGAMQSLAEGYHLLNNGPLRDVSLKDVAEVWQHGSIIESTLNQLVLEIIQENPKLHGVEGYVADSGEGRWTLEAAKAEGIAMPALSSALEVRAQSQQGNVTFATQLLAALRNKFGGHAINKN